MTVTTTPPPVRRERRPVATDPTPRAARRSEVLPLIAAHACVGFLLRREGAHMTVQSGDACFSARLAAGCLLQPDPGDTVACLRVAPDQAWLPAVLHRESDAPNLLRCAGPTRLEVEGGALTLAAAALSLESSDLCVQTERAQIHAQEAQVHGRQLHLVASSVKLVGTVLSTVFDRVMHFSKHHLRTTEGLDRVQATHLECEAQQLLRLEGEHALINGAKLVKTQGAQIHFG